MTVAAIVMVVLLAVLVVFQLALALGAPLGRAAWGGRHEGVLPARPRIASALAALVVYPMMILHVLASAALVEVGWLPVGPVGMWILAGFLSLGTVANFASRSRPERIWGPVSLVLAVCAASIAMGM